MRGRGAGRPAQEGSDNKNHAGGRDGLVYLAKCNCNDLFGAKRCLYGKNSYCERISTSMTDYEGLRARGVSRAEARTNYGPLPVL